MVPAEDLGRPQKSITILVPIVLVGHNDSVFRIEKFGVYCISRTNFFIVYIVVLAAASVDVLVRK